MEKLRFYAIEGLDGVGKTTLINNISKKGFKTFKTPNNIYSELRKELHYLNKSSLFFYLSSLAFLFEKEIDTQVNNFFVDRYLFSTIANYAYKNNLSMKEVSELFEIFYNFLPKPEYTFFLVLDYEKRVERIKKRNLIEKNNFDDLNKNYNDYILKMIFSYNSSPKIIIEADKPEETLLDEVLNQIL